MDTTRSGCNDAFATTAECAALVTVDGGGDDPFELTGTAQLGSVALLDGGAGTDTLRIIGEINGDAYYFYNNGADRLVLKGVQVAQLSLDDSAWV
ncbi:hypothetical protein [Dankookia sp. P2]|uniref:hypothetical protein n=1 Tax=Dankookia sp. P2 TaxID=3423955 RepID=UPI003D671E1C